MNKQVFDNSDSQLPQGWQASSGDEIDLRELILVLWRQKVLILLITSVFRGWYRLCTAGASAMVYQGGDRRAQA